MMRSHQIAGMIVWLSFVFVAVNSDVVSAQSAALSLDFPPLMPQEEAARLRASASSDGARKLFPSTVEIVTPSRPMPYYQRNYSSKWSGGPLDERMNRRQKLAEKIGEQGRARLAAEQGWIQLLGSRNRGVRQGLDAVYEDPRSGRVLALESKGGNAQPRTSSKFSARQGTNQYSIRSAKYVLTRYRKAATREMKVHMARALLAAEKRQLDTVVISTSHVHGKPDAPKSDGPDSANVAREARKARREIVKRYPETREYFQQASREHWNHRKTFLAKRLKYQAPQGLAAVGLAGALGLGWDAYQQSRMAWAMFDDPALKGSVLHYMHTGMAFGGAAQASTLGVVSTAQLSLKLSTKEGIGRAAGKAFLPVMLGMEGLQWATTYHEYGLGRISQREFYRRSVGPAIMAVFTVGGATVGGIVGFKAGGVGAIPVAKIGANIGAFVAIPVQFAADYTVNWYYRGFDEQQRRAVDAAVETFYGLEARNHVVQH